MHELTLAHAVEYAKMGLRVFPVGPSKRPMTANGFHAGTTDVTRIQQMWRGQDVPMIGVVHDRFTVLDFDGEPGRQSYREYGYLFPEPLAMVETRSGGLHMYYMNPPGPLKRNIKTRPGLDILQGDGGYVIVPPSRGYTFLKGDMETVMGIVNG